MDKNIYNIICLLSFYLLIFHSLNWIINYQFQYKRKIQNIVNHLECKLNLDSQNSHKNFIFNTKEVRTKLKL